MICPLPERIKELEEAFGPIDAHRIWKASGYKYPNIDQAQQILNEYNERPFTADKKLYNYQLEMWNTNKGRYTYFSREKAMADRQRLINTFGDLVRNTIETAKEGYYVTNVLKPQFKYIDISEGYSRDINYFNGDSSLLEQEAKDTQDLEAFIKENEEYLTREEIIDYYKQCK